jgi:DNA repair exonuclease SbcCD ATPase subunit
MRDDSDLDKIIRVAIWAWIAEQMEKFENVTDHQQRESMASMNAKGNLCPSCGQELPQAQGEQEEQAMVSDTETPSDLESVRFRRRERPS